MYSRRFAWFGSLSLCLAACSSAEEENPGPPPFSGISGNLPAAAAGSVGQPASAPGASPDSAGSTPPVEGSDPGQGETSPVPSDAPLVPPVEPVPAMEPVSPPAGTTDPAMVGGSGGAGAETPVEQPPPPPPPSTGPVGPGPSSLPAPPGADNVPRPAGAAGDITVLNWAGFQGAVTYSFDDNNNSQVQNYARLAALDVPFTFYLWTGQPSASNTVWRTALQDGHEIGNHTLSHNPNVCTAGDINSATQFIQQNFGVAARTMAAPNGNTCYKAAANGLFFINRGVSPARPVLPNDNSDPLNLNCYIPATGQQTNVFNNNVNDARAQGGWVIYVVHGFTGDGSAFQPVAIDQLVNAISYTKSLGDMWIGTMADVGAYWLGQKAFSQAMTTQNGNQKTWSWNLPGQFPPGKYLRVRVDGGTLTQNGQVLTWDPHGYYEVALDARSVTLSP